MNLLLTGAGPEELAWARALAAHPSHRLVATWTGPGPDAHDLDTAFARSRADAVIVGGPPDVRAEALARAAALGLAALALHPPGPDADPYYHAALNQHETGCVLVPALPARLVPGLARLRAALDAAGTTEPPAFVLHEWTVDPAEGGLLDRAFPHAADAVRALIGEIASVNATGDRPGADPGSRLVVHLRGSNGARAEIRLVQGPAAPARLAVTTPSGVLALEHDPTFDGPARLVEQPAAGPATVTVLEPFDPHAALLDALDRARSGEPVRPDLTDGLRSLEVTEAVARSLARGRTVELQHAEPSELGNFKSTMTGLGCGLLAATLVLVPLALAGPALGFPWTLYLAWAIPPALVLFALLQTLRFVLALPERDRPAPSIPEGPDRA